MTAVSEDNEHFTPYFSHPRDIYHHAAVNNYMAHREIHTALWQHLNSLFDDNFTVLDLGCGDARYISKTLQATRIKSYTGIDQSEDALEDAAGNLAAAGISATLIQGDHTRFASLIGEERFRVMIIGFSLHHLPEADKIRFFSDCRQHLRENNGRLLVYDVMRRNNEDREGYLQRYHENAAENWPTLDQQALTQLAEYISISDHPESLESLTDIARQAGFRRSEMLYVDPTGFHQLIEFT
ncbi:MAG: class I SAM-dependent methyltransferase [Thiolinea sp.]